MAEGGSSDVPDTLETFPDERIPEQELHELVDEADGAGALRAIAEHVCAFRHPARMAYIRGMAAAARRAGFAASHDAFAQALRELPNALEPDVRCAWAGQLGPLAAAWHHSGGEAGHKAALGLLGAALDCLEDENEEATSAGQAAVLGIAPLLSAEEIALHVLKPLDGLARHDEDEVRCVMAELLCALGAEVEGMPLQTEVLPRVLRLALDPAYLVRKEVVFGLPKLGARVSEGACLEQLLPAFRSLAGDRVWLVRGSAAASLPAMAALLPPGMRLRRPFTLIKPPPACEARGALVGLWERLAADSSQWVVSAALASLGPLLALLPRSCITDGLLGELRRAADREGAAPGTLLAAAAALPGVAAAAGAGRWAALAPVAAALAASADEQVVFALAQGLPQLAALLGPEEAASQLLPLLQEMQRVGGGSAEAALAPNLAQLLGCLPAGGAQRAGLLRPLLRALHACASWRVREAAAGQLTDLARCLPAEDVRACVLPTALQLCQDPVAAVRQAAAVQCAGLAAHLNSGMQPLQRSAASAEAAGAASAAAGTENGSGRGEEALSNAHAGSSGQGGGERQVLAWFLEQLRAALARSGSYHARAAFVAVCCGLLSHGCAALLAEELLPALLGLAADPVPNVRLAVCRLLRQGALPCRPALLDPGPGEAAAAGEPTGQQSSPAADTTHHVQCDESPDRSAREGEGLASSVCEQGIKQPHAEEAAGSAVGEPGCDGVRTWLLERPGVAAALQQLAKDSDRDVRTMSVM